MIVAGSTFAWFTSQDEVTNRLTASANYGVSIVEDFTPPIDWLPGQTINKDVSAVNTGNVDAYVRLGLLNDLKLTVAGTGAAVNNNNAYSLTDGEALVELQLNAVDAVDQGENNAVKKVPNSVSTLQAGGKLVYSPDTTGYNIDNLEKTSTGVTVADTDHAQNVNSDTFAPTETGYYIFARSTTQTDINGTTTSVTYDGYYFVKGTNSAADKFYDIEIKQVENGSIYQVYALTRQKETVTINNDQFTYSLSGTTLTAKYDPDYDPTVANAAVPNDDGDEIIIDIALDNIGTEGDTWTSHVPEAVANSSGKSAAFYYNQILEAAATSSDFIKTVTLNSAVTEDAFLDMDYNLKVTVESAQVTDDTAKTTAVNAQDWAVYEATVSGSNVTWSART